MFGELRVTRNEKGELLFCLKDVCDSLGLQVGATAKRLGGDINSTNVSSITVLDANNHGQQMYFVTEPDLYRLMQDAITANICETLTETQVAQL